MFCLIGPKLRTMEEVEEWMNLWAEGGIEDDEIYEVFEVYANSLVEHRTERRVPRFRRRLYGNFDLNSMVNEDVVLNFRFRREDLGRLMRNLNIPQEIVIPERGYRVQGITGLCMALRRLAYPNRLSDLERLFGVSGPMISSVVGFVLDLVVLGKGHLLTDLSRLPWLSLDRLTAYAQAVAGKGAPLQNCWGFIDGTARHMCRPTVDQQEYYSGHKRYHCLKYQSIMAPDGIIVSMSGPYQGRRHDAAIWRMSELAQQLRTVCVERSTNRKFVLYGDPAYPISDILISPFPSTSSDTNASQFNKRMSSVRQAVEWGFAKIVRDFAFLDFSKNLKLLLQDLPTMFKAGTIFTNCHTCLYGGQIPEYFGISPPTLEEYLGS